MNPFDVKTLFNLFALCNFFIGVLLLIFNQQNTNEKKTTYVYAAGKFLIALSYYLFSLRGSQDLFIAYVLPNFLVLISTFTELYCFNRLTKDFKPRLYLKYFLATVLLSLSLLYYMNEPPFIKVVHMSFLISIYYLAGSIVLLKSKRGFRSIRVIGILGMIVGLIFAVKVFTSLSDDSAGLLSQNALNIASYLSTFIIPFCWTILYLQTLNEIAQRQILLKNQEIASDNKKLKELNTTKNKIFSIIAHDLRGPIGGILQLGQMLSGKMVDLSEKDKDEIIEALTKTASSTNILLNNLLLWARSESGDLSFEPKNLSIYQLVEENYLLLKENMAQKNIGFSNQVPKDLAVYADPNMASTILRNLIGNAIKFTPDGGEITILGHLKNSTSVTISVIDNGVGIDEEIINKLFNSEFNHFSKGTNNESGTGLGLKLCKEFIDRNQGKISVESMKGQGTTFHLELPVEKS